jgi:hypothetical protein
MENADSLLSMGIVATVLVYSIVSEQVRQRLSELTNLDRVNNPNT